MSVRSTAEMADASADGYQEVPGMAPHASASRTCDYYLPADLPPPETALQQCEREAYLFSCLPGGHQLETGSMCISNPVSPWLTHPPPPRPALHY